MIAPCDDANVLRAINEGKIRRLAVIVVNARSDKPSKLYQQAGQPGLVAQINAVTSVPIDANTANSEVALSALVSEFAQAADAARRQAKFGGMAVYGITVDCDQIPADTAAHIALRNRAKDVPTARTLIPAATANHRRGRPFFAAAPSLLSRFACRSARCAARFIGRRPGIDDPVQDQNRDQKSRDSVELSVGHRVKQACRIQPTVNNLAECARRKLRSGR